MSAKVLVLSGYGLNCEEETLFAFEHVGLEGSIMHINDLIDTPQKLEKTQILVVPGGFSYGDDTGSGNAFAQKMRLALWEPLQKFIQRDTLTLGICNGCQIITNLGLISPPQAPIGKRVVAVTHNLSARYQCRWIDIKATSINSPWLNDIERMHIPVAHGEGRFILEDNALSAMKDQIAFQYIAPDNELAKGVFPYNPNGSVEDIAGMVDPSGRILALMPHPERGMFVWQRDDYDSLKDKAFREKKVLEEESTGMALFRNAAKYFESSSSASALKKKKTA